MVCGRRHANAPALLIDVNPQMIRHRSLTQTYLSFLAQKNITLLDELKNGVGNRVAGKTAPTGGGILRVVNGVGMHQINTTMRGIGTIILGIHGMMAGKTYQRHAQTLR